jgi:hypothetical protein
MLMVQVTLVLGAPIHPSENKGAPPSPPPPQDDGVILIEVFSQLVSGHWKFDHLDSLISQSHKNIADRLQDHIQINMIQTLPLDHIPMNQQQQQQQQRQKPIMMRPTETMEYGLLKSQMMNAIQARTQGMLPEMWDQMGGEALGRPKMERMIREFLRSSCPPPSPSLLHHRHQEAAAKEVKDRVTLSCLQKHLARFSSQLNNYIQTHLTQIWNQLHQQALPDLLDSTAKDLENLIAYFNHNINNLQHHRIHLTVLPWDDSAPPPLLSFIDQDDSDDHSLFSNFVSMAKVEV